MRQLSFLVVSSQQSMCHTVESPHPQAAGGYPQQFIDAGAHFPGRLIGKGHRQDAVGGQAIGLHQPGDTVDQYPGLATTGPG